MSAFRVVATDLDLTFLRSTYDVDPFVVDVVRRVQEAGALFVPVTARSPRSVAPICEQFGIEGFAICGNGAIVYDLARGEIVHHRPLEAAIARKLVAALREASPQAVFGAEAELRFVHEPGYTFSVKVPDHLLTTMEMLDAIEHPVSKLVMKHPDASLDTLIEVARRIAGAEAHVTTSGGHWVEIQAVGVTKGATLASFCEQRGIRAREVVAFGDHPNDLPMLEWAGYAVAPANAHAEVLAAVDEVAPSNDDDGVAVVLDRLLAEGRIARA